MKRLFFAILIALIFIITACGGGNANSPDKLSTGAPVLTVTGGGSSKTYTLADLQALPAGESSFRDVAYTGVTLSVLLQDAGFDPATVQAVKAVAADGFGSNYEAELANKPDTLVSYARADGPLAEDEGPFRMVIPGNDGKVNVRQLTTLQVYQ